MALYNPTVGVNIISALFAFDHLGERHVTPTTKSLRIGPHSTLRGVGIMHEVLVWHRETEIALDFHVFKVQDFDILIGHPVEKLFLDVSVLGGLKVSLGGKPFTLPIGQTKNSMAESVPQEEPVEEVLAVMPEDDSKPSLERDAELFIQEEDDLEEKLELPIHEKPTRPPIELKVLPDGLRYAFLNGDTQTPVIISSHLSDEETTKLLAILEKHRPVFGYSLEDLKGISPTLCTHRIPIDSTCTPSREPQHRLNNTMRDVIKKEVLKLLHAGASASTKQHDPDSKASARANDPPSASDPP
jgi:hypothetical protein